MGPTDWGRSYRMGRKPSTNKLKMDSKGSAKHGDHHFQFFQKNKRSFHFFRIFFTFVSIVITCSKQRIPTLPARSASYASFFLGGHGRARGGTQELQHRVLTSSPAKKVGDVDWKNGGLIVYISRF